MKKSSVIIIIFTAAYSLLFYKQHAGLNFLLFSAILILFSLLNNRQLLKQKIWYFYAAMVLFSAVFIFVHGSLLAVWANILSLLLLSAFSFNFQASVLLNLFSSVYSVVSSPVFMIIKSIALKKEGKISNGLNFLVLLIPLFFGLLFFFIYKTANPLFAEFTKKISLDFISIQWIFFTTGGFILVYGFFFHQRISPLDQWENKLALELNEGLCNAPKWKERTAFVILFCLLNLMLLFINVLDINYLYLDAGMPEGVTHKQFVHHGVGMLILSILTGISLILYFFRGKLNFDSSKLSKLLCLLWILQNIFMLFSTLIRHNMYVFDALLSYKRIGVYFWLLMALVGLITTLVKLQKVKTIWYLIKINSSIAFFVFILSSCIDWDFFITNFNLSRMQREDISSLDKHYLLSLSETNIPALYEIKDKSGFETDSSYSYRNFDKASNISWLDQKLFRFLKILAEDDWRSFSLKDRRLYEEITALFSSAKIKSLDLSREHRISLLPLFKLKNINELNLSGCYPKKLSELNNFKELTTLYLDNNNLYTLDSLYENKNLIHLSAKQNNLDDLAFLVRFPSLSNADFTSNNILLLNSMPILKQLKSLSLDGNPLRDISSLSELPELEILSLNNLAKGFGVLPSFKKLRELSLAGSVFAIIPAFYNKNSFPTLTFLDLSNDSLSNIDFLFYYDENKKTFVSKTALLKTLKLNNNHLDSLDHFELLRDLETLSVNNNKIQKTDFLLLFSKLKKLEISNNYINDISFLKNLPLFTEIDLSGNNYITDFSPLQKSVNLTSLNLSNTSFDDLSFVRCEQTLTNLMLENCKLKSLQGIEKFAMLETLSISYLKSKDIALLKKIKSLKQLKLSSTEKTVINKIKQELPGLSVIEGIVP